MRAEAIVRLLQHGELTVGDIVSIGGAGWNPKETRELVALLEHAGLIRLCGDIRGSYCLRVGIDEALRRLRAGGDGWSAPSGVAEGEPGMSDLRRAAGLHDPSPKGSGRKTTIGSYVQGSRGLGRMGARRAGAAHAGHAVLAGLVGVGS